MTTSPGILIDTGPLVALVNERDPGHVACLRVAQHLPPHPLLTTWPCFTEAMYLLGAARGGRYHRPLWQLRKSRRLILHDLSNDEANRMEILMEQYKDTPMDLADASLVAIAETLSLREIFTLDSHFFAYRLADGSALEVLR